MMRTTNEDFPSRSFQLEMIKFSTRQSSSNLQLISKFVLISAWIIGQKFMNYTNMIDQLILVKINENIIVS